MTATARRVSMTPSITTLPDRSRKGSKGDPTGPAIAADDILFPRVYEDAWGGTEPSLARSDIDRARIFLMRLGNMTPEPAMRALLRDIAVDTTLNRTVPTMAAAVQSRVFGNRHSTLETSPLLQGIRFMLIKARVTGNVYSDRTKEVIDFFFDPAVATNLVPPPPNAISFKYPAARLKVCIIGGGPTALASAISLAEKGAGKVEVNVWERRWVRYSRPDGSTYVDYPPTAKRRDQVVTLQDSVTTLLTPASYQALFEGRPERVWPGSANIQIRKVEDRFLKRCQSDEFKGLIHLHAEGVTREDLAKCGDFHVLLGADGAASWVRRSFFHGYEKERGRSYALGLAFDRKEGLPWPQPLNVFLTLGQTRYLLNASHHDGRGYLNMQLTEEEWHKMTDITGQPVTFGNPGCLRRPDGSIPDGFKESQVFAPGEDRDSALWKTIEDGLKLFGFKESEVINVVRIPIVVQAVQEGVQLLPQTDSASLLRPRALVAVAGDAAMTVHFWPGRGLNSGIKAGLALGDEIVHALNSGRFAGLHLDAMKEYNDFILKLQDREHDKRSIPILNQSGTPETLGWLLSKAEAVPEEVAVEWLVGATKQIASRLQERSDWAFDYVPNVEPQIRIVLRQLHSLTLREMAVSFPWPTREMGGAEVLPVRSMKPEEKESWMQQLLGLLDGGKKDGAAPKRPRSVSAADEVSGRFEAPRQSRSRSPSPSPALLGSDLRRSNAARSFRAPSPSAGPRFEQSLTVPGAPRPARPNRSPNSDGVSPIEPGPVSMTRLLSVRRPKQEVFDDALQLALFRVVDPS